MFDAMFVLQHLLLPPGIIVVLLAGMAFRSFRRSETGTGLLALLLAGGLYGLSIGPVADRLIGELEARYAIPAHPDGDAIVLMGGGVHGGAADLTGTGFPSEGMLPRVVTAARLQKKLGVPVVVTGGKVFAHRDAEAPVVARVLADLGVPRGKILVEDRSRTTAENALFSKATLASRGLRRPLLVTSAWHMERSMAAFRMAGIEATPVPAGFLTWKGEPYRWMDFLPSIGSLRTATTALRERLGLLYLGFRA